MIRINGYNLSKNLFININLIFEQNDVGKISTSYKICTLNILDDLANFPFPSKIEINSVVKFLIFPFILCFTLYNIFDILIETIKNIRESKFTNNGFQLGGSFNDIWFYFRILKIYVFFFSIILRTYLYLTLTEFFKTARKMEIYADVEGKCELLESITLVEIFIICSTLIYFFRYLDRNIIKPVSDTMRDSFQQIIIFFTSYLFIILGFSFFCYYVYGVKEPSIYYEFLIFAF